MYDIIILGGGAAGLAAAAYALNKQLSVAVIAENLGGKAGTQQHLRSQAGEEELLGADAIQTLARRVAAHAGAVLHDRVLDVARSHGIFKIETQRHGRLQGRAVLVATGAAPLPLDVPGARQLVNYGLGYSITTHARLLAQKRVAVIGTTTRALRGALELASLGSLVYLVAPNAAGLTSAPAQALGRMPNVTIYTCYQVVEVAGSGGVDHLVIAQDDERSSLRVDAVFADLGLLPNSGVVRRIVQVDDGGFILVDDSNMTTLPGMFAAGDVTTMPAENIFVAIGDGTRAAVSAYEYLLMQPKPIEIETAG